MDTTVHSTLAAVVTMVAVRQVERDEVLEVRRQARPQRLGLADVDDPAVAVPEAVDARVKRDLPGGGAVGRRVSHTPTLGAGADGGRGGRAGMAQETEMPSPVTDTDFEGSGLVAGPDATSPVAMSNLLPWHGR